MSKSSINITNYVQGFTGIDVDTFVTEVRLHHTLYTGLANQIYGTNIEPIVPHKPQNELIHMENNPFHLHKRPVSSTTTSTSTTSSTTTTTTSTERPSQIDEPINLPDIDIESK